MSVVCSYLYLNIRSTLDTELIYTRFISKNFCFYCYVYVFIHSFLQFTLTIYSILFIGQQNVPMPPRPSSSSQSDSQQQQQQQSQQQQQQSPSSQPSATQQQQIAAPARGAVTHSPSSQQPGAYSYKMAASQPQSMPPYAPQQYPQGSNSLT